MLLTYTIAVKRIVLVTIEVNPKKFLETRIIRQKGKIETSVCGKNAKLPESLVSNLLKKV